MNVNQKTPVFSIVIPTYNRKVEPLTFYLNLLKYPVRQTQGGRRSWRIALLFLLSQVTNTAGFFQQQVQNLFDPQQRQV
ncbi:MAG: hypothetical protein GY801_21455 [bacterium]|nr:hypothetical protein [bacterium]